MGWGSQLWLSIHTVALSAPAVMTSADAERYAAFYEQDVPNAVPCKECVQHYRRMLAQQPVRPHLTGNMPLFEWTVQMHNTVNKRLGKPVVSLQRALAMYQGA